MGVFVILKNVIGIILGCVLASFGTAIFLLPSKLSSGGFSGIATILYYLFNFKIGTVIILLNIPLFIYSYFKISKSFTIKSVFATVMYSKFIDMFEGINVYIEDRFLSCIYGGVFIGIGLALVLKCGASTGGTDLVAQIAVKRRINAKISTIIIIIDIIVVCLNIIVFKAIEIGLYSFITIWIIGKMIDLLFEGINYSKIIYIISKKNSIISETLSRDLDKGITNIYAESGFDKKEIKIIMCVCKRYDVENIKNEVYKNDRNAFIIIANAREVFGLGFKNHQGF